MRVAPRRGKSIIICKRAFALTGRTRTVLITQGDALGYVLPAPPGRNTRHPHTQGDALGYVLPAPFGAQQ